MAQTKQTVLITGATSGIGLELAKLFAGNGHKLIIVARTEQDLNNTAASLKQEYGAEVEIIAKDLFDVGNAFQLYDDIAARGLKVDILVNDAAQGQFGEFVETDLRRQLSIIELNISSVVALTHLYLKEMVARGDGKILNLSSIAGKLPGPWQSVYHGTKAFIQSFTEAIRSEVKDKGVTVTALLPGATDTDFFNKADMNESKMLQDKDNLSNPADVAKDGYDALMRGDDMVISGWKNKFQVGMSNVTPDEKVADQMNEMQGPVSDNK